MLLKTILNGYIHTNNSTDPSQRDNYFGLLSKKYKLIHVD
jgi:hypothetical protein